MEEDKNYINLIHGDLTRAAQVQNGMPENVGVMSIKTANRTILEASLLPIPRALWDCFWYEGELSCLFADSNVGKSILAVQIADRIARTDNVLYMDFELSEKQFQLRYTNEYGNLYTFPEKLYRVSLDCNSLLDANFEEAIINSIEQMALQTDCKIFIVDNLTYLCCAMEKGDAAGRLMIQLNNLKRRYELSILVLAHTPKRSLDCPITSNDLAGSKRLYNFFDSVFTIGKSAQDSGLRYVKQLKVRYGTFSHDSDNVIVYEIDKVDAFLQFVFRGYSTEKEHLKKLGENESSQRDCLILQLSQSGKSVREIASQVNCGKSTVSRIIQRSKEDRKATVPSVPPSQPTGSGTTGQGGTAGTIMEEKQTEQLAGQEKKEDKA
ncbi:AAA family ATPase [Bacteroides eggerthii]|uniref:AAA family ATPase n=1 Tax=Bacteroides eggerthii TaxID=28111 RepID=UPI001C245986|nr:AAA family ATPase [Bacteroides eggerthii]MBU8973831.1 AAA family ATPase [Bacteroides eggerthii]MBU8998647.1 AAA family ATPase [Bacteroides eggerthii]MCG4760118.1 AAA family ATPase [Bacteroides eggerthii]